MSIDQSKRSFIKKGLILGAGIPLVGSTLFSCEKAERSLNILILGGTSFLGPHQVAYALARGHNVSTFTRGKTKPTIYTDLFDQVEMLVGDRVDNLTALENRTWDVVIDNSGRAADWTYRTAELLKSSVSQYIYVSSTGVYYPHTTADVDEDFPILYEDSLTSEGNPPERDSFGVMKAKSERETIKVMGADRSTIVRPTYMTGPADRTDRFMHWPLRLSHPGEVMVPGKSSDPVQYIDIRDVAEWMIRLAENKTMGTFNAVGPESSQGILDYVKGASSAFNQEHSFTVIDNYDFLRTNRLGFAIPWIMPNGDYMASARVKNANALANGLTLRPLKETIKDVYDWWYSAAVTEERREAYLAGRENIMKREQEILSNWKARG